VRRLLVCALFFAGALSGLYAQNFKPFSKLKTIRTEHFEFIFPEESKRTAFFLAGRAEGVYRRLSDLFGIELTERVPVSITPDTDEVNGYMNPVPYSHILVFDTPEFIDFTTFENTIENLFTHELVHAVTAGSKSPLVKALRNIFGGWVNLLAFNAPWFMIEGAAVAIESEGGFGRANDPVIRERLRQDALEGRFKTPFQTEGAWDLPPGANLYYYYGGIFCTYLIKTYGPEKFRELWRQIGSVFHFSPAKYNNGFYYIFKKVYGIKILDAWKDFENDIALKKPDAKEPDVVYKNRGYISSIADSAAYGGLVYFLEKNSGNVYVYNTKTKKTKTVVRADSAAYAIDVSPDGRRLLLSTYIRTGAVTGQLSQAVVREYKTNGFATGRVFKKMYYARYFRDGIAGIASDTHNTRIVYRPFAAGAGEEILLTGSAELVFGSISPLDSTRFAFILAAKGRREIAVYDYEQKKAWSFGEPAKERGADWWNYVRNLRYSEGRLLFQYNNNDRMTKLGEIRFDKPDAPRALFYSADFSGGVHLPVLSGGEVYYKTAFSATDVLSRYDGAAAGGNTEFPLTLRPWSAARLAESGLAKDGQPAADFLTAEERETASQVMHNWEWYHFFPNFGNPFNLWVPLPYINQPPVSIEGAARLSGLGGFFYISDPFDSNLLFLEAYYDWEFNMLAIKDLTWINYTFGIPIYFYYSDVVLSYIEPARRNLRPQVYLYFKFPLFNNRLSFLARPGISSYHSFAAPKNSVKNKQWVSAYEWTNDLSNSYFLNLELTLSNLHTASWEAFGNGMSAGVFMHTWLFRDDYNPSYEGVITAAAEPLPLVRFSGVKQTLYAAFWENGLLSIAGEGNVTQQRFASVALTEYAPLRSREKLKWVTGGETELTVLKLEAQANFSHLYFNRFFFTLAYRFGYWNSQLGPGVPEFLHSVVARLKMNYTVTPVGVLPIRLQPLLWFSLKLSALDGTVNDTPFSFGYSFQYSY
jgi:hypothetical protein